MFLWWLKSTADTNNHLTADVEKQLLRSGADRTLHSQADSSLLSASNRRLGLQGIRFNAKCLTQIKRMKIQFIGIYLLEQRCDFFGEPFTKKFEGCHLTLNKTWAESQVFRSGPFFLYISSFVLYLLFCDSKLGQYLEHFCRALNPSYF